MSPKALAAASRRPTFLTSQVFGIVEGDGFDQ